MTSPPCPIAHWVALSELYFEALTTEEEERSLRHYLAHCEEAHPTLQAARAAMGLAAVARRHEAPTEARNETGTQDFLRGKEKKLRGKKKILHGTQNDSPPNLSSPLLAPVFSQAVYPALKKVAAVAILAFVVGTSWWSYDYLLPHSVAYIDGQRTTDPSVVDAQMHQALHEIFSAETPLPTIDAQLQDAFATLPDVSSSP